MCVCIFNVMTTETSLTRGGYVGDVETSVVCDEVRVEVDPGCRARGPDWSGGGGTEVLPQKRVFWEETIPDLEPKGTQIS